ncbi:hypothetical protein K492DRAFT_142726 [Lichtheimia hyalospora FSU 10163]|nr:hypothetical protein K492DRAFT_142726 [Lichtheimia hyalospora FSU 10163]
MPNSASSTSTYTTLMRVTKAGRPYCQDLNDLFAALVIQHGLKDHRYRFRTISNSFVLNEAIQVLGHLQFTHISKTPDPAHPTRLIATRTTTTFTMSPHMARTLGQYFATSRLLENAVDPTNRVMKDKVIWILTPKAKFVIQDFAKRAQVSIAHIQPALLKIESFNVAVLERLHDHDDMIAFARPNMTIAFKTMMAYLPMESLMADDAGVLGIETKHLEEYQYTFFGYQAYEWICEYTTAVTKEEAETVAAEYVLYGWISQVLDKSDRDNSVKDDSVTFRMGRNTMYHVTSRGRQVLGWDRPSSSVSSQLDRHEVIVQRQRTLASRLKSSSSNSNIAINTQSKPVPINKTTPSVSTPSPTATTSSTPSSTSGDSTIDGDESSADALNGFQGVEGLEFNMPMEQNDDKKQHAPAATTAQHKTDIDEVTERLLQLRANGQQKHDNGLGKSRKQSISRPSSIIMGPSNSNSIDFITSAPMETVLDPHSHWYKLRQILNDPLLRMYFRDFLKSQYCEENVNIWVNFYELRKKCNKGGLSSRELLQDGYSIYDTYLAPDAPSEVNINHALKQEIIAFIASNFTVHHSGSNTDGHHHQSTLTGGVPFGANAFQPAGQQMTVIVNGHATQCLRSLLKLYERVNEHICRTMAQDAIPRFIKTDKYHQLTVQPRPTTSVTRRNSTLSRYDRDNLDQDHLEEE